MNWPEHKSPTEGNESIAPYNFVPLPERVFEHPEKREVIEKLHGKYDPMRHTGSIDLTITTETPLYTGCAYDPALGEGDLIKEPARQQFFHHGDPEIPFIPGSTIRGMMRTLVEIIGYGKVTWTKDRRLFFRSMEGGKLTKEYLDALITRDTKVDDRSHRQHVGYKPNVCAGVLRKVGPTYWIEPCEFTRVEQAEMKSSTGLSHLSGKGPQSVPNWSLQHKHVVVTIECAAAWHFHGGKYLWYRKVLSIRLGSTAGPGEKKGILVITGGVGSRKHMEFVFIPKAGQVDVEPNVVESFEDKDQLTNWQEGAFPKDEPKAGCREAAGALRDGEPVFYLPDASGKKALMIGRAQMFRLPYQHRTSEFVPEKLRNEEILDLAEAIFGTVVERGADRAGGSEQAHKAGGSAGRQASTAAIKGRVSFEDARCVTDEPFLGGANDGRRVPPILSSPKPTAFQSYLVQRFEDKDRLHNYNSKPVRDTVVRGHKWYWHKPHTSDLGVEDPQTARLKSDGTVVEQWDKRESQWKESKQHTVIRPVRRNVEFKTRIHFENLSLVELGALLTALQLPETMRHKLGMGKPLGLGSVALHSILHLTDRVSRYQCFSGDGEESAEKAQCLQKEAMEEFADKILLHEKTEEHELWAIPRLRALAALLEWKDAPAANKTRYVGVEEGGKNNQWRGRRVLPTAPRVADAEPANPIATRTGSSKSKAKYKPGQKVSATVVEKKGNSVTVELEDGTRVCFQQPYYPHAPGTSVKVKVKTVDASGSKVTGVRV